MAVQIIVKAIAQWIIKNNTKEQVAKNLALKALGKYAGRQVLRRTGIWGLFGSITKYDGKGLTKKQILVELTKSVIKKNLLRTLGPTNFLVDIFKKRGGIKFALKQFGWQKVMPMSIKKLWYLKQNYNSLKGKPQKSVGKDELMKDMKEALWEKLNSNKHTTNWKLNAIEEIQKAKEVPQEFKDELLDGWITFNVKSVCGSFNKHSYKYNPKTGTLYAWVVSADKNGVPHPGASPRMYPAYNVSVELIRKSIKTTSYGKMIYWKYYK